MSAAFAAAVSTWRTSAVPDSPEARLRVVARNKAISELTRGTRTVILPTEVFVSLEDTLVPGDPIDDRLALMFVCAHPAIDPRLHAPLMLQTVLGVDATRIATVFLTSPATMGQRLSRAKTKIRDAGIRFRKPETPDEFAGRLASVLQAVYAAYGLSDPTSEPLLERDAALRAEAVQLAELLTELAPRQPETWGLLALLLHTESRRPGRVVDGELVPLALQERAAGRWRSGGERTSASPGRRRSARSGGSSSRPRSARCTRRAPGAMRRTGCHRDPVSRAPPHRAVHRRHHRRGECADRARSDRRGGCPPGFHSARERPASSAVLGVRRPARSGSRRPGGRACRVEHGHRAHRRSRAPAVPDPQPA